LLAAFLCRSRDNSSTPASGEDESAHDRDTSVAAIQTRCGSARPDPGFIAFWRGDLFVADWGPGVVYRIQARESPR
jgi:hypothetical protein